jgi:hypothetical protein
MDEAEIVEGVLAGWPVCKKCGDLFEPWVNLGTIYGDVWGRLCEQCARLKYVSYAGEISGADIDAGMAFLKKLPNEVWEK